MRFPVNRGSSGCRLVAIAFSVLLAVEIVKRVLNRGAQVAAGVATRFATVRDRDSATHRIMLSAVLRALEGISNQETAVRMTGCPEKTVVCCIDSRNG